MNPATTQQAPRWLPRSTARQAFVVTLCSAGDIDTALAMLDETLGELTITARQHLDDNRCALTVDCTPVRAWSLLQDLRSRLQASDVYLQPASTPPIRLLICDMDMTIVVAETLDEAAAALGMGERIAAITARAMHGELDFDASLRERIEMLAGQPEQVFHDVADQLQLNLGATELLDAAKAAGVHCVLVSGGFAQVAEPVARRLGFDEVYCNHLEIVDGRLGGAVHAPIVNADYKCRILQKCARKLGVGLVECCAIGDGANDLPMLRAAGLGIAYRAKPILHAASSCHIDTTDLASAIYFMRLDNANKGLGTSD
ncbi:MAG: phosphoserine phosphatase SerB [Gammaproteobacteria bacterium]|nr:phosphoserine phosphatase SerB [Gammaproteobacteria bacterium]